MRSIDSLKTQKNMAQQNETTKSRPRVLKTFSLDETIVQQISDIAEMQNRSVSNTVETALKQWASERDRRELTL